MIEISRAGVKDHGMVTALLFQYAEEQGLRQGLDRDRWEGVLAGLLDSDAWLFLLAADGDGEPVGIAVMNWSLTLFGSSVDGRIVALMVDRSRRGEGVGGMLMEELLAASRRRGCREVEVAVNAGDDVEAFYRKFLPDDCRTMLGWYCSD